MNYIQKTPFMELYEELSTLNEAEAVLAEPTDNLTSSNGVTAMDITNMLSEQFMQLTAACNAINKATGIINGITPAGVFLGLPQQILQGFDYNPANIACHYSSKVTWHFLNEDGVAVLISSSKKAKLIANNFFDLSRSWLFFCVRGTNSAALLDSLATELALDPSKVKLVKICDGLKNATKDTRILGLPYGTDANNFILKPFCSWVDSLMIKKEPAAAIQDNVVDNVVSFDDFKQAKEFIKKFTDEHPTRIQCTEDGRPRAIHVPTLVEYYLNQPIEKEVMDVLLKTYFNGTTLGKNPDPAHPHRSVQYLYNAIQQERVMTQNGFTHNGTATNAGKNVQDSYEWLVQRASSTADFYFRDQTSITIEAKQGLPVSPDPVATGRRLIKSAHNAQYVVHFSYILNTKEGISNNPGTWYLYKRANKISGAKQDKGTLYILVTKDRITTDFEQELFSKVQELNNNKKSSSLELVRL